MSINLVVPGLYIGNYTSALDSELIKKLNINTIINCTTKNNKLDDVVYLQIPINDPPEQKDIEYVNNNYQNIVEFIDKQLAFGSVLIHCVMGSQRSAAITAIYLMSKYGLYYNYAIMFLKSKRSICFFGNVNYFKSLTYVQNELYPDKQI
jgi:protein-tyrosine phosphatase